MSKVNVYNLDGTVKEELKLSDGVFNVAPKKDVIHSVITAYLANLRGSYAHTKTRGEVRGGGRKPWKQKGTGRARHGSIRSPLWIGGGITFGPRKERTYKTKVNKKLKDLAMKMLLSDKLAENGLVVFEKFDLKEPKTKLFIGILKKFEKELKKGKGLVLTNEKNAKLASRNLPKLENMEARNLSPLDVIESQYLIFDKENLKNLEKRLSK